MLKILSIRIASFAIVLALGACASGPEKRVTEGEGPVSARARNALATENPAGLVRVGAGFERAGDLTAAYKLYVQAGAAAPALLAAQIGQARVMGKMGQFEESIDRLLALKAAHKGDVAIQRELVEAYIRAGDYGAATDALKPLLVTEKATAESLDLAGRLAQVRGNSREARQYFDRALKKVPDNMMVTRHIALSFALDEDYQTAVALLQANLDNAMTRQPAQETLALVYALSGQYQAAMTIVKAIMDPKDVSSLRYFYALLPKLKPMQKAEAVLFDRIPKDVVKRMVPNGSN